MGKQQLKKNAEYP